MNRNLDDYNRMRDFSATSEPAAVKRTGRKTAAEHALQQFPETANPVNAVKGVEEMPG